MFYLGVGEYYVWQRRNYVFALPTSSKIKKPSDNHNTTYFLLGIKKQNIWQQENLRTLFGNTKIFNFYTDSLR